MGIGQTQPREQDLNKITLWYEPEGCPPKFIGVWRKGNNCENN